jgi:hypothetical protein
VALHRKLYPTTDQPPRFYGLPKVHKTNMPMRPIVSSIGTISYECARYLSTVLSPLVGQSVHHVKNSKEFSEEIRSYSLDEDEELRSFDVSALFTSVPVEKALEVVKERLTSDISLPNRTTLNPDEITRLLGLCLRCTYFTFQGEFYLQIHGAAMGSPVSPIICNLYMEEFERKTLASALHPPRLWKRYVDDTAVIQKREHATEFQQHLNSVDKCIQWTTEGESMVNAERSLPFLDTLILVNSDGSLRTRIYRKDTHTDQYLNFCSNHPMEHKAGVVRTLNHRAESVVSDASEKESEKKHLEKVLGFNGYPKSVMIKSKPKGRQTAQDTVVQVDRPKRPPVVIPYIQGVSEHMRRVMHQYSVQVFFKPVNTLRQLLVRPKDPLEKERVIGPVYQIKCQDCEASYVGETERALKARFLEHRRPSSAGSEVSRHLHTDSKGHSVSLEGTNILCVEPKYFERGVKEAINIRKLKPSLNRDGGRYQLPSIWNNVLTREGEGGAQPGNLPRSQ